MASRPPSPSQAGPTKQRHHPLLQRPLYAFHLPPTILEHIKLRSIDVEPAAIAPAARNTTQATTTSISASAPSSTGLTCTLCASHPTFASPAHQRAHFRSDWHRYNLQLTLKAPKGTAPPVVDEKQWEAFVEDLPSDDESGANTPATSDEEGAGGTPQKAADLVSQVMRKLNIGTNGRSDGANGAADEDSDLEDEEFDADGRPRRSVTAKSALLWFTTPAPDSNTPALLEQTQLGMYRTLFPDPASKSVEHLQSQAAADPAGWHLAALKGMQSEPLRRPAAHKGSKGGWRGKRLKGMDEAAGLLGISFLEGEGFIPGLVTRVGQEASKHADLEEDEEESDGEISSSSDEEEEVQSDLASTASSVPRGIDPPLRTWTIILFGGGHFSAAVVALNPYLPPRAATKNRPLPAPGSDEEILNEDRCIVVLAHKAFHRYTTRRKQGGAQSTQDATGRFAKSAGAQLRRAGEAALAEETRALLGMRGWRKLVGESERIYVRANARAARGILWSWPGASGADMAHTASPLEGPRSDGRLCTIPFSTRSSKATVGECLRVFAELSRVKIARRTEAELQEEDETYRRSLASNDASAREELKKRRAREREEREKGMKAAREEARRKREMRGSMSGEEKKKRERVERLVDMVRRGRIQPLANLWEKHGAELLEGGVQADINAPLPAWWRASELTPSKDGVASQKAQLVPSTLLQLAAEAGQADVIQWLLVEKRADPTIGIPPPPAEQAAVPDSAEAPQYWSHRTAYDLLPSSSRPARNVFRRLFAQQPDWYDWAGTGVGGARVESALTEEMEGNQNRRRQNMREKARARQEAAEAKKEKNAAAAPSPQPEPVIPAPAPVASSTTKNRLGGPGPAGGSTAPRALQQHVDKMEGVSPEMRMRIEREKRARAAEERMKRLQGQ
ncbi:hypothetical protein BDZ90DRAFT_232427 [Jaminaea rosea]|uniref:VLRF1 domain-containing protein n=1 Tax=Jaminaea rosea TaxID=1569628 RepID=A0A316UQ81_9BASI|nr:hypothetical protein BDZ90DRAFT_232427 [Jaminaea rosea]PWN27457.1 hypothetical protein BDZ90DRAFT_232427 [Jaminaea rosea]